jgi:hypothetical protein
MAAIGRHVIHSPHTLVSPELTAPRPLFADRPHPPCPQRLKWDPMLHATQLVEPGRKLKRQAEQIILWHRK